jgi:hypothetical protein
VCFGSGPKWVSDGRVDGRVLGGIRGSGSVALFVVGLRLRCKEPCKESHLVNGAEQLAVMLRETESFQQRCNVVSLCFEHQTLSSPRTSPL